MVHLVNLRTLQYLVALDETRHFGQAAAQCFVSQPTLSAQLKKLEDELGVELVERRHKNVMLTPVGEDVVARARQMHGLVKEIQDISRYHQNPYAGHLSLGFIPTLGPYLLPHVVSVLADELPDVQFYFAEHQTADLVPRLASGQLDVAFLAVPHGQKETVPLVTRSLFKERFVAAVPGGHKLAAAERIPVSAMANDELLLLQDGHCLRDQALDVCGIGDEVLQRKMAATSLETLRQMVAAGQGITLLPELAVKREAPSRIAVRRFMNPEPTREVAAMWRATSVRAQVIEKVCELVIAATSEYLKAH